METIATRAIKIIAENLGSVTADVKPENHLVNDLGADSLDKVELVMALEDEFEIEIPDEAFDSIQTVQHVIDHITTMVPA